ncbi:MAG: ABC transporter ATP-binding protein [Clostridiaceae bacterium]
MSNLDNTYTLSNKERWETLLWILKSVHEGNRNYLPLELLRMVATLGKIFMPIILMAPLLDSLINRNWDRAMFWGIFMPILSFIVGYLERTLYWKTMIMGEKLSEELRAEMHLHTLEIDYVSSRDTEEKKRFQLAFMNMNLGVGDFQTLVSRLTNLLTDFLGIALASSITIWMLMTKPASKGLLGKVAEPGASMGITLIALFLVFIYQKRSTDRFAKEKREKQLKHASVEQILKYYIKEVGSAVKNYALYQLNDMYSMISNHIEKNSRKSADFFAVRARIQQKENNIQGLVAAIILLLSYGLVGIKVLSGAVSAAMILTCVNSFIQMNTSLSGLILRLELIDYSLIYFKDIHLYMNRKNLYNTGTIPIEKRSDNEVSLSFDNVGFKYPGTDKWVLKNVNLDFDMKRRHAIVGPNGAGKTTFILLLCRLYEPTEGRILLNGIDIRKYNYEEYLSLFSVVFQDFQLFAFPLGENVACKIDYNEEHVRKNLVKSGFREVLKELDEKNTSALHKGLSQPVSTNWGSEESFSGGEQQKIAIARALAKSGSVVILDEPTAALDPISEADIYEHLNELIEDKTTIFISHRMSSCRFCEDIIVFDKGQVVERGNHENLIERRGLYNSMWNAQAKYYMEQSV